MNNYRESKELRNKIINLEEDNKRYREEYEKIKKAGILLNDLYVTKCLKIKKLRNEIKKLKNKEQRSQESTSYYGYLKTDIRFLQ